MTQQLVKITLLMLLSFFTPAFMAGTASSAVLIVANHTILINGSANITLDGRIYYQNDSINFTSNFSYEPVIINVTVLNVTLINVTANVTNITATFNFSNQTTIILLNYTSPITVQNVTFDYAQIVSSGVALLNVTSSDASEKCAKSVKDFINEKVVPAQIEIDRATENVEMCSKEKVSLNMTIVERDAQIRNYADFIQRERTEKNWIFWILLILATLFGIVIIAIIGQTFKSSASQN